MTDANLPGEKLLIKIIESCEKGIGTILRPWILKRDGKAKAISSATEIRTHFLALEKLREDINDVRSGKKKIDDDFKLIENQSETEASQDVASPEIDEMKQRYLESLREQRIAPHRLIEIERQINLAQIGLMAAEEAISDENDQVDDEPIDPDWFAQWRNRAQDISNNDMQRLWAKVLKGQAKNVGSFSIHTMDFLSRMSREDAELISALGNFAIANSIIFHKKSGVLPANLEENGFHFAKLLYLQDLGIVTGVTGLGSVSRKFHFEEQENGMPFAIIQSNGKALLIARVAGEQEFVSINGIAITHIGRELLQLANCTPQIEYLKEVAAALGTDLYEFYLGDREVNDKKEFRVINIEPLLLPNPNSSP